MCKTVELNCSMKCDGPLEDFVLNFFSSIRELTYYVSLLTILPERSESLFVYFIYLFFFGEMSRPIMAFLSSRDDGCSLNSNNFRLLNVYCDVMLWSDSMDN